MRAECVEMPLVFFLEEFLVSYKSNHCLFFSDFSGYCLLSSIRLTLSYYAFKDF